ncbi:MAG: peptidase C15 [Lyngbya sp. HA4199-MV5]|jgi:pyroglutamyl-peptidase|nr:peptidase C15 [Lyngbya sp. HA4199-MV5]
MPTKLLLTSFDIWKAHHRSNASDDLLNILIEQALLATLDAEITLLQKLPVDFQRAPQAVIAQLDALQPDVVVCCGMAETRSHLTIESNGKHQARTLQTTVDIDRLVDGLAMTHISHDAGAFVCNDLYYSVLKHIADRRLACQCLFVHVPVLNEVNREPIMKDFLTILRSL